MVFVGSLTTVLSILVNFMTPITLGNSISSNEEEGKLRQLVRWIMSKTKKASIIFVIVQSIAQLNINLILNLIFKDKRRKSNEETSFMTLISVLISIYIITLIYWILAFALYPDIFKEVIDLILNNIDANIISIEFVISILLDSFSTIITVIRLKNFIRLGLLIIISIYYIGLIYHGLNEIDHLKDKGWTVFRIKSINLKNIGVLSIVVCIFFTITNQVPIIDTLSVIILLFSIFNIEISITAATAVIAPIAIEKVAVYSYNHIINKGHIRESNAFKDF